MYPVRFLLVGIHGEFEKEKGLIDLLVLFVVAEPKMVVVGFERRKTEKRNKRKVGTGFFFKFFILFYYYYYS